MERSILGNKNIEKEQYLPQLGARNKIMIMGNRTERQKGIKTSVQKKKYFSKLNSFTPTEDFEYFEQYLEELLKYF